MKIIKRALFNIFVVLFFAIGVYVYSYTELAAKTYGFYFPVVSPLEIISIEETTAFGIKSSRIKGFAVKKYDDSTCQFQKVEWFLKTGGAVESKFVSKAKSNNAGIIYWENLLVGVHPSRIEQTYSIVEHRCFNRKVYTKFYGDKL